MSKLTLGFVIWQLICLHIKIPDNSTRLTFKLGCLFGSLIKFFYLMCYITYDMDFRFVPSDPACFGKLSHFDKWTGRWQRDQGTRVQQVCNRKETTWWEPRAQIWTEAEMTVDLEKRSRSEASLTTFQGCPIVGIPWLPEEDMGRRSPLSEYMSLHPSLTHHRNINPLKNKVWEIYFL